MNLTAFLDIGGIWSFAIYSAFSKLTEGVTVVIASDPDKDFIGAEVIGIDFYYIVGDFGNIIKHIKQSRRIQGSALELDHLAPSAYNGAEPCRIPATLAWRS